MGGDGSPKKVIDGIIYNHKKNKENFLKYLEIKKKLKITYLDKIDKKFYEIIDTKKKLLKIPIVL